MGVLDEPTQHIVRSIEFLTGDDPSLLKDEVAAVRMAQPLTAPAVMAVKKRRWVRMSAMMTGAAAMIMLAKLTL